MIRKITQTIAASLLLANVSIGQSIPMPAHVVILIEENYSWSDIIGNSNCPHLNALANDTAYGARLDNCWAITHPSQPNYLEFFSGASQGCADDNLITTTFTTPNLAAELAGVGKTFVTYSEGLPNVGYNGYSSGLYVRKHNPVANWMGTGTNQVPTSDNQPYTAFPASTAYSTLPTVSYVVPNEVNDMHDGSAPTNQIAGDTWYYNNLESYRSWCLANNSLLMVVFDEGNDVGPNQIPAIIYGPMVQGGHYASKHEDLYSLLRTLEEMYHTTTHAGAAASATAINYIWRSTTGVNELQNNGVSFTAYPNPATDAVTFRASQTLSSTATVTITNVMGQVIGTYSMTANEFSVNTSSFAEGLYTYHVTAENNAVQTGKLMIARH